MALNFTIWKTTNPTTTKEVTKHSTHESSVLKEVRPPGYAMS